MKYLMTLISLVFLSACSNKDIRINGLVCPEGYSQHQVAKDLSACHYYDEKAAAKASHAPLKPECIECLEAKGYEIED